MDLLSEVYLKKGQIEKANEALQHYKAVKDSLSRRTKEAEIAFQNTRFEVQKLNYDLNIQTSIANYEREKSKTRNLYLIILGSVLSVVVIFAVIIIKNLKRIQLLNKNNNALEKLKYQQEIDFKKKEVLDFSFHITEKNKVLESVISNLKNLELNRNELKVEIANIITEIKNNIRSHEHDVALYDKVQEHSDEFLQYIFNEYPDLSSKELKIIKMLRLDYSSKQIAAHLNLSINSVDTYRSRIRKKLVVPKSQKLSEFIQKI